MGGKQRGNSISEPQKMSNSLTGLAALAGHETEMGTANDVSRRMEIQTT